jgi:timeless
MGKQTEEAEGEEASGGSASSSDNDDDEPIYRERKFNLMSEFAVVVEYSVVDKVFHLIEGEYYNY